ncbi:hyalin-like [Antedon mediterranea]|uniref:hyalin-like n=1 Tax=Antedon mediterranea TaxID=105859 RepID=UPI003AF5C12F
MKIIKLKYKEPPSCPPGSGNFTTNIGRSYATIDISTTFYAIDNAGEVFSNVTAGLQIYPIGKSVETFSASDSSGNNVTCTVEINVRDEEPPACPPFISNFNNDPGSDIATIFFPTVFHPTDNSGQVFSNLSTMFYPLGKSEETLVVTDSSGNSVACTVEINVRDTEQPVLNCPEDMLTPLKENETVNIWLPMINASDNTNDILIIRPHPEDIFPVNLGVGDFYFTFTANDSSGNVGSCTFRITILDIIPPELDCPPVYTVYTNPGNDIGRVDLSNLIKATDNSGEVEIHQILRTNYTIGRRVENYTASDPSGNNVECTVEIHVQDITPPELDCPPGYTFYTNPGSDKGTVDLSNLIKATDNSGEVQIHQTLRMNYSIGRRVENYTASDPSGNNVECTVEIYVQAKIKHIKLIKLRQ